MFSLTIAFGPAGGAWALMYKTRDRAEDAYKAASSPTLGPLMLADDFGQAAIFNRSSIHGAMLEDMDESKLAHIERALHDARTRARADQAAQADPILKTAMMGRGPAMLTPMGNNGGFPRN